MTIVIISVEKGCFHNDNNNNDNKNNKERLLATAAARLVGWKLDSISIIYYK
jgi:hypothetical protein